MIVMYFRLRSDQKILKKSLDCYCWHHLGLAPLTSIGKLTKRWVYQGWTPCCARFPGTRLYMMKLKGANFQSSYPIVRSHSFRRVS